MKGHSSKGEKLMKLALAVLLEVTFFACSGAPLAQQAPAAPPAQQHQMGPMMMCPMMQMAPGQMKQAQAPPEYQAGERIYAANCAFCHANGGNTVTPGLPVVGSPQLKDFNTFLAFNRNPQIPTNPTGPKRMMPAVSEGKITDRQMNELYRYIVHVLHPKSR
jgi:mono/diheme cytochrome c family protein